MGLPLDPSPWHGSAPASHGCRPPLPDGWHLHSLQQGRFPLLPALPPMANPCCGARPGSSPFHSRHPPHLLQIGEEEPQVLRREEIHVACARCLIEWMNQRSLLLLRIPSLFSVGKLIHY
uniref:Uncharacterized protein n=1 Tax=Zea mays TaxID=4577 RepID=A0A804PEJ6_MAIZE